MGKRAEIFERRRRRFRFQRLNAHRFLPGRIFIETRGAFGIMEQIRNIEMRRKTGALHSDRHERQRRGRIRRRGNAQKNGRNVLVDRNLEKRRSHFGRKSF